MANNSSQKITCCDMSQKVPDLDGQGPEKCSCEHDNEPSGCSWVATQVAAPQEGLSSMKLVYTDSYKPERYLRTFLEPVKPTFVRNNSGCLQQE
jgi:hypothetical protein